jgi:hypothetical protein
MANPTFITYVCFHLHILIITILLKAVEFFSLYIDNNLYIIPFGSLSYV